jgi:hypothetical protein
MGSNSCLVSPLSFPGFRRTLPAITGAVQRSRLPFCVSPWIIIFHGLARGNGSNITGIRTTSTGSSTSTSSKIYRHVFYPAEVPCFLSSTRRLITQSGSCAEKKGFVFRLLKLFKRMSGDSRDQYGHDEELQGDDLGDGMHG